jgi:hypothetical protein
MAVPELISSPVSQRPRLFAAFYCANLDVLASPCVGCSANEAKLTALVSGMTHLPQVQRKYKGSLILFSSFAVLFLSKENLYRSHICKSFLAPWSKLYPTLMPKGSHSTTSDFDRELSGV